MNLNEIADHLERGTAGPDVELVTALREYNRRIQIALEYAEYGSFDGADHRMWVIDQMVRALTGDEYEKWRRDYEAGEYGPDTYYWDEGIAP